MNTKHTVLLCVTKRALGCNIAQNPFLKTYYITKGILFILKYTH